MQKPLTVWLTTNCGKFFKRWEYQTTLPVSFETNMWIKKQQLELDMKQQTNSKLGKEYVKAVYCHAGLFTTEPPRKPLHVQNASHEMPGWMNHELESRLPGHGYTYDLILVDI